MKLFPIVCFYAWDGKDGHDFQVYTIPEKITKKLWLGLPGEVCSVLHNSTVVFCA